MLLVVDNGSVYTKNLLDFLSNSKIKHQQLSFEKIEPEILDKFNSFILSGRRKNDRLMNSINSKIIKYSISKKKPLLGICYGAELLALTIGGTIRKMDSLQKGNNLVLVRIENPISKNQLDVFESHSYEIASISNSFESLADSKNCKHEIIQLKDSSIFGVQFHPEMSNDGQKLIKNFCNLV